MTNADLLAAFRWWSVLTLIGLTAVPFNYWLFHKLPDKGYTLSKMTGLLLVSYLFWFLASLGFLGNNLGGILVGCVGLLLLSGWFYAQSDQQLPAWLKENWRVVLTAEVGFTLLYILWVYVRASNPSITATEKPMEFAFLNSASRSLTYPPLDPWLSGFAISYYYFGYVMMSVVARLAMVSEMIAFNLGMAWLVAGSGLGAFGVVYNLIKGVENEQKSQTRPVSLALPLALLAFLALPIAGNGEMMLEVLYGQGVGSDSFWTTLDVRDLAPPAGTPRYVDADGQPNGSWWWWRASRVISEYHLDGRAEDGLTPIAEFPGFSFVLGDMHPHVLALPFAFLGIALALTWYLAEMSQNDQNPRQDLPAYLKGLIQPLGIERILVTAVILGGLSFLNTWDILVHLFLVIGAYALARWRNAGQFSPVLMADSFFMAVLLLIPAYFLYLPFYLSFSSQAGAPYILPMLMRPTRLIYFFIIFGMPFLAILLMLALLLPQVKKASWRPAVFFFVGFPLALLTIMLLWAWLIASNSAGAGAVSQLAYELNLTLPEANLEGGFASQLSWGLAAVMVILPTVLTIRLQYIALTVLLAGVLAAVVAVWHSSFSAAKEEDSLPAGSLIPFVLLLVFTATMLVLGPEYLYLKDNFGQRLNTIFKFYYQAWVLFGVSGLVALGYVWQKARPAGGVAIAIYLVMFSFALQFPYYAVQSRAVEFRGRADNPDRWPLTLNGLAFVERYHPDEYAAILWLRENIKGNPVILEATGNPYSDFARVSANTGLPTVLGWANHEYQWRGDSTAEPGLRGPMVAELFNSFDWGRKEALLNQYQVEYIFIGRLEKQEYNPQGLQAFERLPVVFQNGSVTIYQWQPTP